MAREPSTEQAVVAALILIRQTAADQAVDDLRVMLQQVDEMRLILLQAIVDGTA